jgi:hypothetical protein
MGQSKDDTTTILIMTIVIALNTGDIAYNDISYNVNKHNITFMFLSAVMS